MQSELIGQYAHTWRIFEGLVRDFDEPAWISTGHGAATPARLSFHILKGVKYYIQDISTVVFASGKSFESNWESASEAQLPSREDILACLCELRARTEAWLSGMDFNAESRSFEWAGKTKLGVVLFLLRHSLYHLGELSALLNASKSGDAQDNWVKAL